MSMTETQPARDSDRLPKQAGRNVPRETPLEGLLSGLEEAHPADAILVMRALAEDPAAFEALVARYQALVSLVALRVLKGVDEVEDVRQEAFVKAFRGLGELKNPARFKAWLLQITANIARDVLRRRRIQGSALACASQMLERAASSGAEETHGPDDLAPLGPAGIRSAIVEAIYELPEAYRDPAAMRYLEESSYEESARRLGLEVGTVRKRMLRANALLRKKLKFMELL